MPFCRRCGARIIDPPLLENPATLTDIWIKGCMGGSLAMLLGCPLLVSLLFGVVFVLSIVPQGASGSMSRLPDANVLAVIGGALVLSVILLHISNRMRRR
jgi:hypothetical protein